VAERAGHAMHTALVQRLMRDRSAWELAHGYDETDEALEIGAGLISTNLPAHA
jgi:UDP-3-O-[3-hydroxymyristoyl] N-acetylglucosamine deacetylase